MTKKTTRQLVLMNFLLYISLGLPDFIFGGAWPILHQQLNLNVQLISVVTAISLGFSLLANFIFMHTKMKFDHFLVLATLLLVIGLLFVLFAEQALLFFMAIPFIGLGQGAIDIAVNSFIASRYSSRVMNLLHAYFGLGVTLSTIFIAISIALTHDIKLAIVIVISLHLFILLHFLRHRKLFRKNKNRIRFSKNTVSLSFKEWLFPLFSFLYAVEQVVGIFLASYLVFLNYQASLAAFITGLFWLSIMTGRFLGAYLGKYLTPTQLLIFFTSLSILGGVLFSLTLPFAPIIFGLGVGPLYPIFMEKPYSLFENHVASKITGFSIQAATTGILIVPILYSLLIEKFGFQSFSLFVIVNLILLIITVTLIWHIHFRKTSN
ncbi:MAG: MFS transporter [Streptococcaceae bacterium]|jgi:fucose permease|nr:MFS transporter [Streptococcaceae bacterium]